VELNEEVVELNHQQSITMSTPTTTPSVDCIRTKLLHKIDRDISTSSESSTFATDTLLSSGGTANVHGKDFDCQTMNSRSTLQVLASPDQEQPIQVIFEPLKICLDSDDDTSTESSSHCDEDSSDSDDFLGLTVSATHVNQDQVDKTLSLSHPAIVTASVASTAIATVSSSSSPATIEYFHKQPHKAIHDSTSADSLSLIVLDTSTAASTNRSSPISNRQQSDLSLTSILGSSTHSCSLDLNISNSSYNKKAKLQHKQKEKPKRRSVSLHKSVSVIPIPSRCSYSSNIREKIWSSSAELCANAARNTVEFASEGWDWRKVVEDEHMLLHQPSGELIHPIHVQNAFLPISSTSDSTENFLNTWNLISGLVPNNNNNNNYIKSNDIKNAINNNYSNTNDNNNNNGDVFVTQPSSTLPTSCTVAVSPDPVSIGDKI
jgi:hypothetical protein